MLKYKTIDFDNITVLLYFDQTNVVYEAFVNILSKTESHYLNGVYILFY